MSYANRGLVRVRDLLVRTARNSSFRQDREILLFVKTRRWRRSSSLSSCSLLYLLVAIQIIVTRLKNQIACIARTKRQKNPSHRTCTKTEE